MRKLLLTALFLLAACAPTGKPPYKVADDLTHEYLGQSANDFFYQYGLPGGEFAFDDGETIYRWTSLHPATIPADITVRRYTSANGLYEVADTYNGNSQSHYCELRVYTDASNIIQKFAVAVDTTGKWSSSRCSEIFEETF